MREETKREHAKIRKVSNILLIAFFLTALSILWMLVMVTWWTYTSPTSTGEHFFVSGETFGVKPEQIQEGLLTARDKSWLMAGMAGVLVLIMPGLYFAIRIIQNFRRSEIFSSMNVIYARRIAILFLVYVALGSLVGLLASWTPREGFAFSFNPLLFSQNYIILGLLWLFVWVLDIGRALNLDSEMTI